MSFEDLVGTEGLSLEEEAAHLEFIKTLGPEPVWFQYLGRM